MSKKILITGATGTIGQRLVEELTSRGDEVTIFTRSPDKAGWKFGDKINIAKWDYTKPDEWKDYLDGIDVVVHLAGVNLSSKRWNEDFKKLAYDSRVVSTRNLVDAIKSVEKKPKAFICSSAVGYYGDRYDEVLNEKSIPGDDYMANLCRDWEAEAAKVEEIGVRRVSLRTAPVLIKGEGLLKELTLPFKLFIGGPLGSGKQWFPWIHIDDIVELYKFAIDNDDLQGAVNAASPGIVRMKEFATIFGKVLHRPSLFKIPKFAMKIVAGELADYAVMSQRISVEKIINAGFNFMFDDLEEALKDLLK